RPLPLPPAPRRNGPSHPRQEAAGNERGLMNGSNRVDIKSGLKVLIVLKKDQHSGKLTEGIVKDILTKSPTHPHGIKVRLESGEIGRVKKIVGG
ncbi:MAG TPA: YwbE family protein, partial [Candidatus Acidoferrum sp.]|nr:YwbE family protein [Candidatus Acidoferrum sp.]